MNHPLQAARRRKWPAWIAGIFVSAAPLASAGIAAVNTGFLIDTVDRTSDTKSFDASGGGNPVMNARLTPAVRSTIQAKYSVGAYYIVVQRDPNASQHGNSTLVFVSTNAWNSRVETGGWFFTQRGNAYCAIKPAGGGYELQLGDMWAPVIVQMGQAGEAFTFYANAKTTPRVNGTTVSLNPAKTYDSPYLSLVHGEEIATVSDPGRPDLIVPLLDAAGDDDLVLRPNSSAKGSNRVSRFPDKPSSRTPIPSP